MTLNSMAETADSPLGRSAAPKVVDARLCVVYPRALATTVSLGADALVFGRRPEAGVRLADATVSRAHLSIRYDREREAHLACDLGSRNGSRVSGRRLGGDPVALEDGDVLRVGDVLAVYERGADLHAADAAAVSRDAIPGQAACVRRLRGEVGRAGPDPSPVLLVGETGTGKEYIARELHRLSGRTGPCLAVNCAALSPQLVESQLFGHARGAFTGAQQAHDGLFRAASGGTLLLDEVGELPLELQPKLLRVLQEGEVHPVGETRPVKVDVRVVAATLRDLGTLAQGGGFRLDLYARLAMWEIRVPALRRRRVDLVEWLERLIAAWHAERGQDAPSPPQGPTLSADAIERLLLHDWVDNLRGLHRLVHRVCSEAGATEVDPAQLDAWLKRPAAERTSAGHGAEPDAPAEPRPGASPRPAKPSKEELLAALAQHGGSVRATAKHYGRDRRQIYRWMEQYGLRSDEPEE